MPASSASTATPTTGLLGEVRPGETPPLHLFPRGSLDVVAEARRLELDFALLQTGFLGDPARFSPAAFLAEAGGVALGLSWGAPEGSRSASAPTRSTASSPGSPRAARSDCL